MFHSFDLIRRDVCFIWYLLCHVKLIYMKTWKKYFIQLSVMKYKYLVQNHDNSDCWIISKFDVSKKTYEQIINIIESNCKYWLKYKNSMMGSII